MKTLSEKNRLVGAIFSMVLAWLCFTLMMASIKYASQLELAAHPNSEPFGSWEAVFLRSIPMTLTCLWSIYRRAARSATSAALPPKSPLGALREALVKLPKGSGQWLTMRGIIGTLSMACLFYGSLHIPLAAASLFANSSVFFVGIFALVFLGESLTPVRIVCTLFGFLGVFLVLFEGLRQGTASHPLLAAEKLGYIAAFLSGLLSAFSYFSVRKMRAIPGDVIILSLAVASFVMSSAAMLWGGAHWPNNPAAFAFLAASTLPAILGQYFMTASYRSAEAALVATGQYMGPVFAAILGAVAFGESLASLQMLGSALVILFGVALPVAESLYLRSDLKK